MDSGTPLSGTRWEVTALLDGETARTLSDEEIPVEVAFTDNRVEVNGCNTGTAEVRFEGSTVVFEPLLMTMRACEGTVNDTERELMTIFDGEVPYEVDGEALTFEHPSGMGIRLARRS